MQPASSVSAIQAEALAHRRSVAALAREDVNAFIAFVMHDEQAQPLIQTDFDRVVQSHVSACWRAGMHAAVAAPFGTGKSFQIAVGRVLWEIGRNPSLQCQLVANIGANSGTRLMAMKRYIADDPILSRGYQQVFPAVRADPLRWAAYSFLVQRTSGGIDPTVEAGGVGTRGTSKRATHVVFDDICDMSNSVCASEPVRLGVRETIKNVWLSRLTAGGHAAMVFTPWHERDASMWLVRQPTWSTLRLACKWDTTAAGAPERPRIEVTVYNPPPGYSLGVAQLAPADPIGATSDPDGAGWPQEAGVYLGDLPVPARYNFKQKYQELGGGRAAELRMGLEPLAEEESVLKHVDDSTIREDMPRGKYRGGIVAIDPAVSGRREGNAAVWLAHDADFGCWVVADVLTASGGIVEFLDRVERLCAAAGGVYPSGPLPVFEVNAQQSGLREMFQQPEFRTRWSCLRHAVPFTTTGAKHDPQTGIQGIDMLLETRRVRLFKPAHVGGCNCGVCKLYYALKGLQLWQLSANNTPDVIMAFWFAVTRLRMQGFAAPRVVNSSTAPDDSDAAMDSASLMRGF